MKNAAIKALLLANIFSYSFLGCSADKTQMESSEGHSFSTWTGRLIATLYDDPYNVKAHKAAAPQIDIYIIKSCPYCQAAASFLKAQNIPFRKHDIDEDAAASQIYDQLGNGRVPLITIDRFVVSGFKPGEIMEHYENAASLRASAAIGRVAGSPRRRP